MDVREAEEAEGREKQARGGVRQRLCWEQERPEKHIIIPDPAGRKLDGVKSAAPEVNLTIIR